MGRQNGRFVKPLIEVRIALVAPVTRALPLLRSPEIPMTHHLRDRLPRGRCVLWTSRPRCGIVGCLGVRHGPREEWWSAHLLRQGDQPLPGLSPLLRGGARGMYLRARTPRGPEKQPKRARVWDISLLVWSS